jgi:hypothetical protein
MEASLHIQLLNEFTRLASDLRAAASRVLASGHGVSAASELMGRELDVLAADAAYRRLPADVAALFSAAAAKVRHTGRNGALGIASVNSAANPRMLVSAVVSVATTELQAMLCPDDRVEAEDPALNATLRRLAKAARSDHGLAGLPGVPSMVPPDRGSTALWPPAPYAPWTAPSFHQPGPPQYSPSIAGSVHYASSPAPPPAAREPPSAREPPATAREPSRAQRRAPAAARPRSGPTMLAWLRKQLGDDVSGCFACALLRVTPPPSDHTHFCSPACTSYPSVAATYKAATGVDPPPRRPS